MKIWTCFITIAFSIFYHQITWISAAEAANKIMPLGNSITDGNDSLDETSYRRTLYLLLAGAGYETDFVGSLANGIPNDFDKDHEGHPGWTDDQILNGRPAEPEKGNLAVWLGDEQPHIVLLHIGTNGLNPSPDDVEAILDEIDAFSPNVWVVLARIINRNCQLDPTPCPQAQITTDFNDNIEVMAQDRIDFGGDKIIIVDMELGAGIDYHLSTDNPPGDMLDNLHPAETGYTKMADLWFVGLQQILPLADAGDPQTVKETATVTLDGSISSDPDGTIASYLWEQVTGSSVTLPGASPSPTASFTAPVVGPSGETLTFKLTVTDNDGLESTDTVSIDVINTITPIADAGPDQDVKEGDTVTLDGSDSSDPDGTITAYLWEQLTGTMVSLSGASTVAASFAAPVVGPNGETLTFKLTVTDDDGLESTAMVNIAVTMLPQANAGPDQSVEELNPVTLDASGSIAAGALSYQWTQTTGTDAGLSSAPSAQPTITFTAPDIAPGSEILTFRLTVTDQDGLEDTDTVNITVNNHTTPDSGGGGGGGGGGGCFITISNNGSSMAPEGNTSLVAPPGIPVAALEFVVAMIAFIRICAAIDLHRRRKRWLKPYYHGCLNLAYKWRANHPFRAALG